jgi:pyridoxine 5-phosphate synthase
MQHPIFLGVNIDHVATLRQARKTHYPEPIHAALLAEEGGADGITVHLREDRRHIQERDVEILKSVLMTRLNLEMALTPEMVQFALKIRPAYCCFVPERREELTTEGGLDVEGQFAKIESATRRLQEEGILVSLFIDPEPSQLKAAQKTTASTIELHTGHYADAKTLAASQMELDRIKTAAKEGAIMGLKVNAGHGLHYKNVEAIAQIPQIYELNIGHGIMARALMTGIKTAVSEMKTLMTQARR